MNSPRVHDNLPTIAYTCAHGGGNPHALALAMFDRKGRGRMRRVCQTQRRFRSFFDFKDFESTPRQWYLITRPNEKMAMICTIYFLHETFLTCNELIS